MAIFSRRVLQRMLTDNAQFDSSSAIKHAQRLNRCTDDTISTEWEVAILNGLSKLGDVRHEPEPDAPAVLDIHFRDADSSLEFVGDVVTVTDFGLEKQNPIEQFEREVVRHAKRLNLRSLAGFFFEYGDWSDGDYRDRKVYVAVPDHSRYSEFFDENFISWLRQVRDDPQHRHVYRKQVPGIDVTIAFTPGERYVTRHVTAFTVPQSLTRNPLYHALDRKAEQLKRAGHTGPSVVFACDGGSRSLHRSLAGTGSYSATDIARRFFADHSVSAVMFVRVEHRMLRNSFSFGPPFLELEVLANPRLPQNMGAELRQLASRLQSTLPAPESMVVNAISHLRWRNRRVGISNVGGLEMNRDYVKMSARALQELLAGRVSSDSFLKEHAFVPSEDRTWTFNPFELALKEGRLIRDVEIERSEDEDDDLVTFFFSDRDSAIAPFKIQS